MKIIGIILIVLAVYLGFNGVNMFASSGESVDILGVEISAEDNKQKSTALLYVGLALISFLGGMFLVRKK